MNQEGAQELIIKPSINMVEKNQEKEVMDGDKETKGKGEEDKRVAECSKHINFRFVCLDCYDGK